LRKAGLNAIFELAKEDNNVVFIGSDLGVDTLKEFKNLLPDQFFMEGVSEGHMVGMAAGMAHAGATVYINTIATFLTRRALDQIVVNLCLDNAKVRLYGNGGGLVYGPLGATHTALEDLSVLSALPNITILAPSDSVEMTDLIKESKDYPGPIYIRLGKGGEDILSTPGRAKIGKAVLDKHPKSPNKILICTTGVMRQRAVKVKELLEKDSIFIDILHHHTIKPLDRNEILSQAPKYETIITLEENVASGGLGQQIGCMLLENSISPKSFIRFSLPDKFPEEYARQEEMFLTLGLDPESIASKIRELYA